MDLDLNPFDCPEGTIILEPRSVYDQGLVRYDSNLGVLVYDYDSLIEAIMVEDRCSCEEAMDWLHHNTMGNQIKGWPIVSSQGENNAR